MIASSAPGRAAMPDGVTLRHVRMSWPAVYRIVQPVAVYMNLFRPENASQSRLVANVLH